MAKAPQRIQIKPAIVDVGRGPQPAAVTYPPVAGTRTRVLPPEGDTVLFEGAAGSYWQRRITEGSVVKVDPSQPATSATLEKEGKH
jgi:hypothetical protein